MLKQRKNNDSSDFITNITNQILLHTALPKPIAEIIANYVITLEMQTFANQISQKQIETIKASLQNPSHLQDVFITIATDEKHKQTRNNLIKQSNEIEGYEAELGCLARTLPCIVKNPLEIRAAYSIATVLIMFSLWAAAEMLEKGNKKSNLPGALTLIGFCICACSSCIKPPVYYKDTINLLQESSALRSTQKSLLAANLHQAFKPTKKPFCLRFWKYGPNLIINLAFGSFLIFSSLYNLKSDPTLYWSLFGAGALLCFATCGCALRSHLNYQAPVDIDGLDTLLTDDEKKAYEDVEEDMLETEGTYDPDEFSTEQKAQNDELPFPEAINLNPFRNTSP